MKKNYIIILGSLVIALFIVLVVISIHDVKKYELKLKPAEMLGRIGDKNHFISPVEVADIIKNNKTGYSFIDIRSPHLIKSQPLGNVISMPIGTVLSENNLKVWNGSDKKIIICNNSVKANEVWMILSEYGIDNIYVMEGGVNALNIFLASGEKNDSLTFDNEYPLYDFSISKNNNDSLSISSSGTGTQPATMPVVKAKKKQKVQGGCS